MLGEPFLLAQQPPRDNVSQAVVQTPLCFSGSSLILQPENLESDF